MEERKDIGLNIIDNCLILRVNSGDCTVRHK